MRLHEWGAAGRPAALLRHSRSTPPEAFHHPVLDALGGFAARVDDFLATAGC